MKRLIFITSLLLLAFVTKCQTPFIGNRLFISADKQDSMWLRFTGDTLKMQTDKGFYVFNKPVFYGKNRLGLQKDIDTIFARLSRGSVDTIQPSGKMKSKYQVDYLANFRNQIKYNDSIILFIPDGTFNNNLFVGTGGGKKLTRSTGNQGWFNIGIGSKTLYQNTTGFHNIAIGFNALNKNTTGNYNIGIGGKTLEAITTALNNTAVGYNSLDSLKTGNSNVAVGWGAGLTATGSFNVYLGASSGTGSPSLKNSGNNNMFQGYQTGMNGIRNNTILIGYQAGFGVANKGINQTGQIKIGYQAGYSDTTSNRLYIENSNSQTPLLGGKFDLDQLGVNKLITSTWTSTLNIGGGVDATFYRTTTDTMETKAAVRAKQNKLTLTTTGTSGAATLTGSTLNIPQYSSGTELPPNTTGEIVLVSKDSEDRLLYLKIDTAAINGVGGGITSFTDGVYKASGNSFWYYPNKTSVGTRRGTWYKGKTYTPGDTIFKFNGILGASTIWSGDSANVQSFFQIYSNGTNNSFINLRTENFGVTQITPVGIDITNNYSQTHGITIYNRPTTLQAPYSIISIYDDPTVSSNFHHHSILRASVSSTVRLLLRPRVVNDIDNDFPGVAYLSDTHNLLTIPETRLWSFRMQGTEKAGIDKDGNYINTTPGGGVIIKSPNGTSFKLSVSDAGTVTVTPL